MIYIEHWLIFDLNNVTLLLLSFASNQIPFSNSDNYIRAINSGKYIPTFLTTAI